MQDREINTIKTPLISVAGIALNGLADVISKIVHLWVAKTIASDFIALRVRCTISISSDNSIMITSHIYVASLVTFLNIP